MSQPTISTQGSATILARTAQGASWVIAWRLVTRLLGLASTLILVRLLAPEDFGLIALAAAFAVTLDVCLAIGLEDQIVRAEVPSRALYDTAFTLGLLRAALVASLLVLAAAPAATFFADERMYSVLLALAASAMLSGFANIGVVEFRRYLQFEREFLLQLLPRIIGIVTTVGLAWWWRDHWALVVGILVNRIGILVMGYVLHPYRPRLSLQAWRGLIGISAWSWAISLATLLRDRSDSLVIGRVMGPTSVGHYSVGVEIATLPTTELVDPICRACMPGFAATRRQGGQYGEHDYLRILALLALFTFPAGFGVSLMAGPIVALAFGQAWLPAVPVILVLGLAGMIAPFGNVSSAMLTAHARLRNILFIVLATGTVKLGLLVALTPSLGLPGAAFAVGIGALVEAVLLVASALRLLGIGPGALLLRLWRPALCAAMMGLALWLTGLGWVGTPESAGAAVRVLLPGVALGAGIYVVSVTTLWWMRGRPSGAEADLLMLIGRALRRVLRARGATPAGQEV